jgi:Predicted membrane protein
MILIGALRLGWYIDEIAALFIIMMIITGFVAGYGPSKIATVFIEACAGIVLGALVVGVARTILIVMIQGQIIDTVINGLSAPLSLLPSGANAAGMLGVQNILNFFIPSGSGQAATVMPIMTPLSDLIGVNRQIAVLAFQFGDGYSNMLWPTTGIVVMCAIGKIPLDRWWRFFVPLFGIMLVLQLICIFIAVAIGLGPF